MGSNAHGASVYCFRGGEERPQERTDAMIKQRHCYCDRLYPGFQCAYCRLGDYLKDEQKPDPRLAAKAQAQEPVPARSSGWWSRVASYGKSVLRGSAKKQPS